MAQSNKLKLYQVQVRDGVWLTMKLSPEHVERADASRIREVSPKARPTQRSSCRGCSGA